jgi:Arm DNA-binding domain
MGANFAHHLGANRPPAVRGGGCSAVSLAKAREAAAAVMGDVAKGRNPVAERKEAAAAERTKRARDRLTLRALIDD